MTMQRGFPRRDFIRLGLAGSALLPSLVLGNRVPEAQLQWWQVLDDGAAPVAARGDWLAIDPAAHAFVEDGLYLYPAWGQPRPYLVRTAGIMGRQQRLEFCNPVTGRVLWSDSGPAVFAGRIHGRVPALVESWLGHLPCLPPLSVPRLPA
jgi:hypothetical protein